MQLNYIFKIKFKKEKYAMTQTNKVQILPAKAEDTLQLAQVYLHSRQETFPWVKHPTHSDFERDSKGELTLKAVLNDKIVGFISFYEQDNFVHLLFIDPEYMHLGIGRQLIDHVRQLATAPVILKCVRKNTNALAFYKAQGFKIIGKSSWESPAYFTLQDTRKEDYPHFKLR
ncbi:GNAT family N-acetyltransferase [Pediococcus parvulus]|nr:GNAT family N-acetyltransferase [Pediococcus parvulus]